MAVAVDVEERLRLTFHILTLYIWNAMISQSAFRRHGEQKTKTLGPNMVPTLNSASSVCGFSSASTPLISEIIYRIRADDRFGWKHLFQNKLEENRRGCISMSEEEEASLFRARWPNWSPDWEFTTTFFVLGFSKHGPFWFNSICEGLMLRIIFDAVFNSSKGEEELNYKHERDCGNTANKFIPWMKKQSP